MDARQQPGGKVRLGEILLERGLITKDQLDQALHVQVGGMRRLGSILIRMKVLSGDSLTDALATQLHLDVVKVDEEFREGVGRVLPRFLCRKYSVLPLSLESNNVLRLAMADPLDAVAMADVEHYTGMVVEPELARLADIEQAIPVRMAFTRHDLFNPQVYRSVAKAAVGALVVLMAITGVLVYREVLIERYGTAEPRPDGSVIYKHHDLMIDVAKDGSVYFSGRGAYTNGYFGVRFENTAQLTSFVRGVVRQLSAEQIEWLNWAFQEKLKTPETLIAAKTP
jgi:hypothetical protein